MTDLWYGIVVSHVDFVRITSVFLKMFPSVDELTIEHAKAIDKLLDDEEEEDEEDEEEEDENVKDEAITFEGSLEHWASNVDLTGTLFESSLKQLHVEKCADDKQIHKNYSSHLDDCRKVSQLCYNIQCGQVIIGIIVEGDPDDDEEILPVNEFCLKHCQRKQDQIKSDLEYMGFSTETIRIFVTRRTD